MEIRDLKAVLAAMDTGSFARAAEQLFVSRQALSQTVRKLENELGILFFDVADGNKLVPTAEGAIFAAQARPVMNAFDELARAYPALPDGDEALTVALATGVALSLPEGFFSRFAENNAGIVLEFEEGNTEGTLSLLDGGRADIAIVGSSPTMLDANRYEISLLVPTGLWLAVPPTNPLCGLGRLTLQDLEGQRIVTAGRLNHLHRYIMEVTRDAGVHIEIPASSSNTDMLSKLAREYEALCFAFPWAADEDKPPVLPLLTPEADGFGTYAVRRRDSRRSPAARLFWVYACEQSGTLQRAARP